MGLSKYVVPHAFVDLNAYSREVKEGRVAQRNSCQQVKGMLHQLIGEWENIMQKD